MRKKTKEKQDNYYKLDTRNTNKRVEKAKEKKKRVKKKNTKDKKDDLFNLDDEIVIGLTKKVEKPKAGVAKKKTTPKKKKTQKAKSKKKNPEKSAKRIKIVKNVAKWTTLIVILVGALLYFMMSPIFNITNINISGNEKITSEMITSLSGITIGENTFKTSKRQISKNIKQNAYIESVEVKRSLPDQININVKERKATFMLGITDSYVYMNNQGYLLEIQKEKIEKPEIIGYTTPANDLQPGGRLVEEDLERLNTVLNIMEVASGNELVSLITKIDISDKTNYVLYLDTEQKKIYIGDGSDLNTRMLYVKAILENEKGKAGEIFVGGDLNTEKVRFRESV